MGDNFFFDFLFASPDDLAPSKWWSALKKEEVVPKGQPNLSKLRGVQELIPLKVYPPNFMAAKPYPLF